MFHSKLTELEKQATKKTESIDAKSEQRSLYAVLKQVGKEDRIRHVAALPNGRLLVFIMPWEGKGYFEIIDIDTKKVIKKLEIERVKNFELLSENQLVIYKFNENASLYDLELNLLETIKATHCFEHFVEFNKDITIAYERNERNNGLYSKLRSIDPLRAEWQFLEAVGYDKIGFLTSLGSNKMLAVYNNHNLRVVELKDGKFNRVAAMNFWDINEWIESAVKVNDNQFVVCTVVSNSIFSEIKKEEVRHLRVFDTSTLKCVDDIVLPMSFEIDKVEVLSDGKTLIGWHELGNRNKIYLINMETHAQKIITMPDRVMGLSVLSNGNVVVLLDYKKVLELPFSELKLLQDAAIEMRKHLLDCSSLSKDVAGIVTTYLPDEDLIERKTLFSTKIKNDEEMLLEEIKKKIAAYHMPDSCFKFFMKISVKFSVLNLCQNYLETNQHDEKAFVNALSEFHYESKRGKKDNLSDVVEKTLEIIRNRNERLLFQAKP